MQLPAASPSDALAHAPTVGPGYDETARSHVPAQTPELRRRPAVVAATAAVVVLVTVGGLLALRPWQGGAGEPPPLSAPKALQGSWEARLSKGDLRREGALARLLIDAKGTAQYSLLNEVRLCVWESTITASRSDAIKLGSSRLKRVSPQSEAERCEDTTEDYTSSRPDGTGAFVASWNGAFEWEDDPGFYDHHNDGQTSYEPAMFEKVPPATGALPEKFRGSWGGRAADGTYRFEVTMGQGATKRDIRLVSISAVGERCTYKAEVLSQDPTRLRTAPAELADNKQPSGWSTSTASLTFWASEDKGRRKLSSGPLLGADTPFAEARHWVAELTPAGT
ncbi:hypothetical protein [Streptomyces sp. NPDC127114]|uniref:hypothetical protein n=1 Tax=Streptomyces sp. NPDC127114 TaxID=3345366 RepID=UPI003630E4D5